MAVNFLQGDTLQRTWAATTLHTAQSNRPGCCLQTKHSILCTATTYAEPGTHSQTLAKCLMYTTSRHNYQPGHRPVLVLCHCRHTVKAKKNLRRQIVNVILMPFGVNHSAVMKTRTQPALTAGRGSSIAGAALQAAADSPLTLPHLEIFF